MEEQRKAHAVPQAAVCAGSSLMVAKSSIRLAPGVQASRAATAPTMCLGSAHVARNILDTMHEALRMWRGNNRALFEDSAAASAEQRGHMWWGMFQGRPLYFTTQETAEKFRQSRMCALLASVAGGTKLADLKEKARQVQAELAAVQLPDDFPQPPPRYPHVWLDRLAFSLQSSSEKVAGIAARLQHAVRWADLSSLPALAVPIPGAGLGGEGWKAAELEEVSQLFQKFVSAACAQHVLPILNAQRQVDELGAGVTLQLLPPSQLPVLGPSFCTAPLPLKDALKLQLTNPQLLVCDERDMAAALHSARVADKEAPLQPQLPAFRVAGLQLRVRQPDGRLLAFLPAFTSTQHLLTAMQLCRTAAKRAWLLRRQGDRRRQLQQDDLWPTWLQHSWCSLSWLADEVVLNSPWGNKLLGMPEDVVVIPTTVDQLVFRIAKANAAQQTSSAMAAGPAAGPAAGLAAGQAAGPAAELAAGPAPGAAAGVAAGSSDQVAAGSSDQVAAGQPAAAGGDDGSSTLSLLNSLWQLLAQDAWLLSQSPQHEPQLPRSVIRLLASPTEGAVSVSWAARVRPLATCSCSQPSPAQHAELSDTDDALDHDGPGSLVPNTTSTAADTQGGSGSRALAQAPGAAMDTPQAQGGPDRQVTRQAGGELHAGSDTGEESEGEGVVVMFQSGRRRHDLDAHLDCASCAQGSAAPDLVLHVNLDQLSGRARDTCLPVDVVSATGAVKATGSNTTGSLADTVGRSTNTTSNTDGSIAGTAGRSTASNITASTGWSSGSAAAAEPPSTAASAAGGGESPRLQSETPVPNQAEEGVLQQTFHEAADQGPWPEAGTEAPVTLDTRDSVAGAVGIAGGVSAGGQPETEHSAGVHGVDGYGLLLLGDLQIPRSAAPAVWPPEDLQFSQPFDLSAWVAPLHTS